MSGFWTCGTQTWTSSQHIHPFSRTTDHFLILIPSLFLILFRASFFFHLQFSLYPFAHVSLFCSLFKSLLRSPFRSDSQSLKTNPKFPLFRAFLFPPLIIFHSSFPPLARSLSFLEIPLQVSLSVPSHSLLSFNCPLLHLVPISNFIPFIFLSSLPLPPSLLPHSLAA